MITGCFLNADHSINTVFNDSHRLHGPVFLKCSSPHYARKESLGNKYQVFLSSRDPDNVKELNSGSLSDCHIHSTLQIEFNKQQNILKIRTDHFATLVLFYYVDFDGNLIFSDSIKTIIDTAGTKLKRNIHACNEMFDFGYLLYDSTLVEGVKRLPYGCELEFGTKGLKVRRYWDFNFNEEIKSNKESEIRHELHELFSGAVERCLSNVEKIVVPLSGGLDSRAILAETLRHKEVSSVSTYTFGKEGTSDFEIARQVSKSLNLKHHLRPFPNEGDTVYEDFNWQSYFSTIINGSNGTTEVLAGSTDRDTMAMNGFANSYMSGYVGGEIFGSHISEEDLSKAEITQDVYTQAYCGQHLLDVEIDPGRYTSPAGVYSKKLESYETIAGFKMHWDFAVRQQNYIKYGQLLKHQGMFYRCPFLEPDFFTFATENIPMSLKLNEYIYVSMLINEYPDIFRSIPTTYSGGTTIYPGFIQETLFKVGSKLYQKFGIRGLFGFYPKQNILSVEKLIGNQKSLFDYFVRTLEEAVELKLISEADADNCKDTMVSSPVSARMVSRIATVVESIGYFDLA